MIVGEMCLSPVGLSITTKLAPKAFEAQTVAIWLLADAASQALTLKLLVSIHRNRVSIFWDCRTCSCRCWDSLIHCEKPIQNLMGDVR